MSGETNYATLYNGARGGCTRHARQRCAYCVQRATGPVDPLPANAASGVAYKHGDAIFVLCKADWSRCRWSMHRALEEAEAISAAALKAVFASVLEHLRGLDRGVA